MNTDTADKMKDVIAFITARYKDDLDAAKVILGIPEDGIIASYNQAADIIDNLVSLSLVLCDFAINQTEILATIIKTDAETLIKKWAMDVAMITEGQ